MTALNTNTLPDPRSGARLGRGHVLAPDHAAAFAALLDTIVRRLDAGLTVPCIAPATAARWTSRDPADAAAAAFGCQRCAALTECRSYIENHPEDGGTWGGRTEAERGAPR